jgi:IS1 family transposase
MNRLSTAERAQIIRALVEGNSMRSTVRMTGFAMNTIMKLLRDLGRACSEYQDRVLRDLPCERIECDEIWAFVGSKRGNVPEGKEEEYGDLWTWVAIDPVSKLVPSWLVGNRDAADARSFIADLADRLRYRVQLTTDGHRPYLEAVEDAFGADVDYAMLIKLYGSDPNEERRFSPPVVLAQEVRPVSGDPDPMLISTSYVERQNLTMRMSMRRFTRLTNGFSKKAESHAAAVALHYMHYNFGRVHKSLRNPYPRTPAMAAGVADHVWTCEEIAGLLD